MSPRIAIVPVGIRTSFTCYSHTPAIITKDGKMLNIFHVNESSSYIFKLEHPDEKDNGVYNCHGTDEESNSFWTQSHLYTGGIHIILLGIMAAKYRGACC